MIMRFPAIKIVVYCGLTMQVELNHRNASETNELFIRNYVFMCDHGVDADKG
jgi:hypothetical protein